MRSFLCAALVSALALASSSAACSSSSKTTALPPVEPDEPPPPPPTPEETMVTDLAGLNWAKLGHPVVRWDAIPPVKATKEKPHRLLVVLVEFSDYRFERFRGDKNQGEKLAAHYQAQLFDTEYKRKDSLSNYYAAQSAGMYHVDGKVLPPIRLSKPRRAYGSPNRPAGGDWRNDVDTEAMVEEALKLAAESSAAEFPAAEFDRWDPVDHDGDGITDEPDGYLDHFVLVYAGGAQNSCQSLNKIGAVLTPNVGNEALKKLDRRQRECADRLWPHRSAVRLREGQGPTIGDGKHRRGGVPVSDTLWVYDYNMQSEYTDEATFIHEFGHSLGLPDVYSRTSSNSTGSWAVMSSDMRPSPQGMSAWSRIQLGWLKPEIILPPQFGGKSEGTVALARLDDLEASAPRAALVVLPPKKKVIELTETLPEGSKRALYGGQGNEMSRTATRALDLTGFTAAELSLDAWWEIEAGWDFAYIEVSADKGQTWTRQLPTDPQMMPAKHGHDGKQTIPGLTGLSGDLNGDGKNESNPACDPTLEVKSGEDKAGQGDNPCLVPSWVKPAFDLTAFAGKPDVWFRARYYTDGAAVMRGILIDNPVLTGTKAGEPVTMALGTFDDGKEGDKSTDDWKLDGFTPSTGRHELLVPHYYLLEYRDPYTSGSYDSALANSSISFYTRPDNGELAAVEVRRRPGLVMWYADGAYAWSENDPAINGPGKGYALVVDSNANELALPGLEAYLGGSAAAFNTSYDVSSAEAQKKLEAGFKKTACFVRSKAYFPRGIRLRCSGRRPPLNALAVEGKQATYSYQVLNDFLPGARETMRTIGELFDTRTRKDKETGKDVVSYRLRDRSLRHLHTFDAPFSSKPFADGVIHYRVGKKALQRIGASPHPANAKFSDATAARWLNPKLPFGGAALPSVGFSFELDESEVAGVGGSVAEIRFQFRTPAGE